MKSLLILLASACVALGQSFEQSEAFLAAVRQQSPPAAGGGGATFSDDFATTPFTARANYLTTPHFTWNAAGYISSAAGSGSAIYFTTSTGAQNQYIKWKAVSGSYTGCVLRSTGTGSDGYYVLEVYANNAYLQHWDEGGYGSDIQNLGALTVGEGASVGVTVVGSGASTVFRIWVNPTGNAPDSGGATWGSASPGKTSSTDPGTYHTGNFVGLNMEDSADFDDVYAGSVP